jgi:DNA-binding NtrC family response regulator
LREYPVALVLIDVCILGDPPDPLKRLRAAAPRVPVVVRYCIGHAAPALEACGYGAWDVLEQPCVPEDFLRLLRRGLEARSRCLAGPETAVPALCDGPLGGIFSPSPVMRRLALEAHRFRGVDATMLVFGEPGSGKRFVAGAVHASSVHAGRPLVTLDLALAGEETHARELFGSERGGPASAVADSPGALERAAGGTLLLFAVDALAERLQRELVLSLRLGGVSRVGGNWRELGPGFPRVIATTREGAEGEPASARLPPDVRCRLGVVSLRVPPLRERIEDIQELAMQFLREAAARHGRRIDGFEAAALDRLRGHGWPGNVRELQQVVSQAVGATDAGAVQAATIESLLRSAVTPATVRD